MRGDLDPAFGGRLLSVLGARIDRSDLDFAEPPRRLSGGYSADLYGFRLANSPAGLEGPLVVRLMNDDRAAARETIIQGTVAALGFPTPHVRLNGPAADGLGRPFSVMDRLPGTHPVAVSGPFSLWRAFQRVPLMLADTMAALHALETHAVLDRLAAAGWTRSELGAEAALREIERSLPAGAGTSGLNWLRQHRPPAPVRPVVCHGDLHAFNLLSLKGRITAVLDWELATVAAGEFDVARTAVLLSLVPGPMSAAARPFVQALGRRAAREFKLSYAGMHAIDSQSLRWHEALRLIVLVAGDRSGVMSSAVAGLWEPLLPGLARHFAHASGIEPDLRAISTGTNV